MLFWPMLLYKKKLLLPIPRGINGYYAEILSVLWVQKLIMYLLQSLVFLAAAHLAGAGNVKKYLRSDGDFFFKDAFGTTIHNYLKKFSGYDTSSVTPNIKAKAV